MAYFSELPDIDYLSFLPERTSSSEYVRVKNLFRKAKLRDDIINPLIVFEKYQIPDGYRPDNVAEELYGSAEYDWVVLITAGITNIKNDWPISDSDVYRYAFAKYGEELYGIHHFVTREQKDSNGRIILEGDKNISEIIQIPSPSYESGTGEIQVTDFFAAPNSGVSTTQFNVKSNLYILDTSTIKNTNNYGEFSINQDLNIGYGGTWTYDVSLQRLENLNEGTYVDTLSYIAEDGYLKTFKINIVLEDSGPSLTTSINVNYDSTETSYVTFFDDYQNTYVTKTDITNPVTNYGYEILENNKKRSIYVLKPQYLQQFIRDTRSIMKYKKSSQTVRDSDGKLIIRTENLRTSIPYGSTFERPNPTEVITQELA